MRRDFWMKGLWAIVLAAGLLGWGAAEAATKRITLLGGQVGGSWNPWASAMSVDFSKNIPGLNVSSEAGTGSFVRSSCFPTPRSRSSPTAGFSARMASPAANPAGRARIG